MAKKKKLFYRIFTINIDYGYSCDAYEWFYDDYK